jgi:signal transduction histidine kinase
MIRSYVALAGGLMVAALVLDLVFSRLQPAERRGTDAWVGATFRLVESRLLDVPSEARAAALNRIARDASLGVQLLDAAPAGAEASTDPVAVLNSDNERLVLKWSPALGATIRIGPLQEPGTGFGSRVLPMLFYLSILVIVGLWLRPLLRDMTLLTEASRRFSADYREPLRTASQVTQLHDLAHNLDDMSLRLSQMIQGQKELTAALSHEMRTPLARIRFALAVLDNGSRERVREQLREINSDVTQVDNLITRLLEHAKLDHPDLRMDWQEVELHGWLQHVLAAASPPDRPVELAVDGRAGSVNMDPRLMELAVSNLVANAGRYARQVIRVSARQQGSTYQILVEDDGPGVAPDKREEIFRAFTSHDTQRQGSTGGIGLGLAIVSRVAALHGGRAAAGVSADLGGASMLIEWPRQA